MEKSSSQKRILITGATGFLGGYLCREMFKRGINYSIFIRSPQKAKWFYEQNIEVFRGDISNFEQCRQALENQDILIHLAAATDISNPQINEQINIQGLKNLLQASRQSGIGQIIFLSSTCAGRACRDAYGETKLRGEELLKQSGADFTIFRPTMIYGKGSKEFDLFVQVIKYSPIVPILGSGKNVIQPVFVEDAIEIIIASISNAVAVGQTYDLAGPAPISFDDFVEMIGQILALRRRTIIHLPAAPFLSMSKLLGKFFSHVPITVDQVLAFTQNTEVDLNPIRQDFNYSPRTLSEGLALVL